VTHITTSAAGKPLSEGKRKRLKASEIATLKGVAMEGSSGRGGDQGGRCMKQEIKKTP